MPAEIRTIRGPEDFAAAFDVSREAIDRLATYERLIRQWQKAINLISASTLDHIWHRHFADSAQIVRLAPPARSWADLGSGAGFPGLVVAILFAGRPTTAKDLESSGHTHSNKIAQYPRVTLIESDQRKCAFMRTVARETALDVDILSIRIESAATQASLPPAEVVSARALAPLPRLFSLAATLSSASTVGLFFKGKGAAEEIEEARRAWTFEAELVPSLTEADGRILVVRRLEPRKDIDP
jgi:16S rRNA (guanine527-N7)-methyltransferase